MTRSMRYRSKLLPRDVRDAFFNVRDAIDQTVHQDLHPPKLLVYTSKATIGTTAGTQFSPPFSCKLSRAWVSLDAAPASTFSVNLLLSGNTANVDSLDIASTDASPFVSNESILDLDEFVLGVDYLQFQVTAIGSAVGPYKGYVEVEEQL